MMEMNIHKNMRAVVIYEAGGAEQLKLKEVPIPQVKPGWSLVRIRSFGVNRSEIFTRRGYSPSVEFPRILGIECTGLIAASTDEKRLPVGQKVISIMGEMGRAFDGSYAQYTLLPNTQIYPVQTELSWEDLAAVPETGYTAYGSLVNMHLSLDAKILIRGATSGTGITALKMIRGKYPHASVTGSTRKKEKEEMLKRAGFDEVIVDLDGKLQSDEKFDRVLDLIGPAALKDTFCHTVCGGIVCSTGELGGQWTMDDFDPIMDIPDGAMLTSFYSGSVTAERMQKMLDFVRKYQVDLHPEKVFYGLEQVADAHRYLEGKRSFGKTVVRLQDE